MNAAKHWEETMTPAEVDWCWDQLRERSRGLFCVDNFRAARMWKSSQRRRFRRQAADGCCGSESWVARRWSWRKMRFDLYLLGFNYGH